MKIYKKIEYSIWGLFILCILMGAYVLYFHNNYGGKFSNDPSRDLRIERGKELYAKRQCATCHGPKGQTPLTEDYPRITGQNVKYTYNQIYDISQGHRANGMSTHMKNAIGKLTHSEILSISEYLSSIK